MGKRKLIRWTIKKEIFINRGKRTTLYSLGKNVVGFARIFYGTRPEAQRGLKKMTKRGLKKMTKRSKK